MKIIKSLEESDLLTEDVSQTIKNKAKKTPKRWISQNVITYIAASTLGNMLAGKPKIPREGVIRASEGVIPALEGVFRAG